MVVNASMNDGKKKKNVAMQATITSRKETETAKQSPEEKNEVPIFRILQSKHRQIKCLNDEKKCLHSVQNRRTLQCQRAVWITQGSLSNTYLVITI